MFLKVLALMAKTAAFTTDGGGMYELQTGPWTQHLLWLVKSDHKHTTLLLKTVYENM